MFGIGFTEIVLISIIAILFLGPDKLPQAMVEVAKFIKGVKKTVGDAKSSLEEEMKISDLKEEALSYKQQLDDATSELKNFKNIDFNDFDDVSYDDKDAKKEAVTTQVEAKNDLVTFKKKTKEESNDKTDTPKDNA